MWQTLMVIAIVVAAAGYITWQAVRFFVPRPGAKACGGNCCSQGGDPATPSAPQAPRTQMISSDALRARIAARRS